MNCSCQQCCDAILLEDEAEPAHREGPDRGESPSEDVMTWLDGLDVAAAVAAAETDAHRPAWAMPSSRATTRGGESEHLAEALPPSSTGQPHPPQDRARRQVRFLPRFCPAATACAHALGFQTPAQRLMAMKKRGQTGAFR